MKVINLKAAKAKQERKKYSALVLGEFDRQEHQAKQQQREQTAEVRRKARNAV